MRPEDVALLRVPGSVTLRGDLLLTDVARPDLESDSYRGGLVRVPTDGSEPQPWTRGERDTAPRISPDGRWVAFLRDRQLYVIATDGGEARRVTDLPGGAGTPVWAPDSRRVAFAARVPEEGRYGIDGAPAAEAEAPRRITDLRYRLDGVGFLRDRVQQLFVVDVLAEEEPHRLTDGDVDLDDPTWTPDGQHVLAVGARQDAGPQNLHDDVYAVPAAGGQLVVAVRGEGMITSIAAAEGRIYLLGSEFTGLAARPLPDGVWVAPFDPAGSPQPPRLLTDPRTVDCEGGTGNLVVTADGVLALVRNRGAVELRLVPVDADRAPLDDLPVIAGGQVVVKTFAEDAGRIAVVVSTPESAGEVVLVGTDVKTDFGADLRAAGIRPLREIHGTAPDGYPVHGWVVLPEGDGPHPVLLNVHGGPFMYYGWGLFDEAQVYASAGYAVVLPNPRGSAGYGFDHGVAIVNALGTVDADDVLALLDAALELPECDAERVGVMGGSYGGFMTSWLAAHHGHRFKAAWSERAVNAWDSFVGSSDIGWWFGQVYCGSDPDVQRAVSPLTYADKIRIPFAVVHSEQDWRCPIEQAQRMFVALKSNGTEAELLLFPGEGHELTRSGRPVHRRQRFDAVLDWWQRHLGESIGTGTR
ncbi:S9 family peptidase [Kutzneria kofuensis]|uniref:Dipeptidyl aminopeptidase/acylaminoacyl peptidase n=1 Tax=Kutzneria kofuensis TaxID=103725 RepID=A0A7W9NJR2_9PSEU|nr:S9 family peptidase [Kutzneria kofuensis]MBB5894606.1 dipeptidyl aminopeptidase/acylaminoacyl peptidase [Kutzneria kofuensis]